MTITNVNVQAVPRTPAVQTRSPPLDVGRNAKTDTEPVATPESQRGSAEANGEVRQTSEELARDVEQLNEIMQDVRRELKFSVDEDTGETVIKVLNASTQEVVRQIPAEEVLALMSHLQQQGQSLMVDVEA